MDQTKLTGYQYRFCIEGHIRIDWVDWPYSVQIQHTFDQEGRRAITVLTAVLPDQPALYGLLEILRDHNLKLVYAQRDETLFENRPSIQI